MRPVTSCRIVRQTLSVPAFALSITILCADHLTGYAMICYIEAPRNCMLQRTHLIFALSVLGSDFPHFRGGCTPWLLFHINPICHCMRPVTSCRIVRQTLSVPAFALSVLILCADCLTGYVMMIYYIEAPRNCMLRRTPLVFALSVLGSDFLHFRGGPHTLLSSHMSLHETHYKL